MTYRELMGRQVENDYDSFLDVRRLRLCTSPAARA